ncbi:ORFL304W [Human betaherpesvirus 5]|nr:ORFL304W [Human betaherpesvirus 5]
MDPSAAEQLTEHVVVPKVEHKKKEK